MAESSMSCKLQSGKHAPHFATAIHAIFPEVANQEAAMNTTAFVLLVLVGTSPPYSRGEFTSYESCVEAARGQVETLQAIEGHAVTWHLCRRWKIRTGNSAAGHGPASSVKAMRASVHGSEIR
jgi:hypothetical protein